MADTLRQHVTKATRTLVLLAVLAAPTAFSVHAQGPVWNWAHGLDAGSSEYVRDIAVEPLTGNMYVVGAYQASAPTAAPFGLPPSNNGSQDAFLVKFDPNGNLIWSRTVGSSQPDAANGVAVGPSGHVVITGYNIGSIPAMGLSNAGNADAFVITFNDSGTFLWAKSIKGSQNDEGTGVVFAGGNLVAYGMFVNQGVLGGLPNIIGLSIGRRYAYLNAYDLAGNLSWSLTGVSNSHILSERIAADANNVYVTGLTEGSSFAWQNPSGNTYTTTSTTNANALYASAVSLGGTPVWSRSINNPGDSDVECNGVAVNCSGVYITGRTHNGSVFPGGATLSAPGAHDHFFLASLGLAAGNTQWIRSAKSTIAHGVTGYDLVTSLNQQIMVVGSMAGAVTTDGGVAIPGANDDDQFIWRFSPDGTSIWYDRTANSGIEHPMAIAAASAGHYVIGGQISDGLVLGSTVIPNGSGDDLFVAGFTDPNYLAFANDPSRFAQPGPFCEATAPIDLNAFLVDYASGVASSLSVSDPGNAINAPDNSGAVFTAPGAELVLDLGDTIQAGESVRVWWRSQTNGVPAQLLISSSLDQITYGAPQTWSTSSTTWNSVIYTVPSTARFIRLQRAGSVSFTTLQVDALRYLNNTLSGGTWSGGPHVTATGIFTPTGPGSYPVSYTVASGACTYSSNKIIQVDPNAVGGSISGGGIYCPSSTGILILSGHTGIVQRWQSSPDGTLWTNIPNTTTTLPWSSIGGTLQFRAQLKSGACGMATSSVATLVVEDTTPPAVVCPSSDSLYTTGISCGATYIVPTISGTDNCAGMIVGGTVQVTVAGGGSVTVDGADTVADDPVDLGTGSEVVLPPGVHLFVDTIFDGNGNFSVCNWSITVLDTVPPVLACPPGTVSINADAASCTGTMIDLLGLVAIVGDNCTSDADLVLTQTPAIGAVVSSGDAAAVNLADSTGNSTTCTFSISVIDAEAPVFDNCPSPSNMEVDPPLGACSYLYVFPTITSTDNCDPDTETGYRTFLLEAGNSIWQEVTGQTDHALAPGIHQLYEVHADDAGNSDTCFWSVTVRDDEAPVITVPANILVSAEANACGATVSFAVGVSDNCAVLDTTFSQASGSFFPSGTTTVTVDANDINGNAATQASFTVTVEDDTPPSITCPGNIARNISDPITCTHSAAWPQPTFSDNCSSASITQTSGLPSGSQFSLGVHPISYTVQDADGNVASCAFTVTINDISAPSIVCPLYDTLPIPLGPGCSVAFPDLRDSLTVTDCSPWTNAMDPLPGTVFTRDTVLYMTMWVEDSAGNGLSNDHWVHIMDLEPPTINCPADINTNATAGTCGATVNYAAPVGMDNCSSPITTLSMGLASGSLFPIGSTTVSYHVIDAAGLTAGCSFTVTVEPSVLPVLNYSQSNFCETSGMQSPLAAMPIGGTFTCATCAAGIGTDGTFDASAIGTGTHTISYTAPNGSCYASPTTSTTVTIEAQADAGSDRSVAACAGGPPFQLIDSLGGSPEGGGSWHFQGLPHPDTFDPSDDAAGAYTYLIPGGGMQ